MKKSQLNMTVIGLSIRGGTRYFYLPKMVFGTFFVPPDFKECCIDIHENCSNFDKKKYRL